jgi:hypothetical protein
MKEMQEVDQTRAIAIKCSDEERKYVPLLRRAETTDLQASKSSKPDMPDYQNGVDRPFFDCLLLNRWFFLFPFSSCSSPRLAWLLVK